MDPKLREKLTLALKIGSCVLISASLTLIIVRFFGGPKCCDPVSELPQLDLAAIENVPSADFNTLVGFSGYLKFDRNGKQAEQYSYLKLRLNSTHLKRHAKGTRALILNTNCANVTLDFESQDQVMVVKSMEIALFNSEADYMGSCLINKLGIFVRPTSSYFCYSEREYFCEVASSSRKSHLVSLVVDALRFELDGDVKSIEKRQFSKPTEFCF